MIRLSRFHSSADASISDIGSVAVGISEPTDCFDRETLRFLLGPTKTGLTCASFVLAVFQQSGLPLVVCESWPKPNEEDIEWQKLIVKILKGKQRKGR